MPGLRFLKEERAPVHLIQCTGTSQAISYSRVLQLPWYVYLVYDHTHTVSTVAWVKVVGVVEGKKFISHEAAPAVPEPASLRYSHRKALSRR
eukprot:6173159-Pleurochrysis_carterae.AAC.4